MTEPWTLAWLGDAALTVRVEAEAPLAANAGVHRLARRLTRAAVAGVRDIVPGMRELVIHVDPLRCDVLEVQRALRAIDDGRAGPGGGLGGRSDGGQVLEVPVHYGGDAGPDLAEVAASCRLSPEDVCQRHAAAEYVVCFVGFLPGFPYLGLLDGALQLPRRATPRPRVPPGSVAIAGEYTGIYPCASPGGWHIIGRTDVSLFDLHAVPPARLSPGMRVRFVIGQVHR